MTELLIRPVVGIGEVRPGDDLAELIIAAAPWIRSGDVLVVTSKIVSKAEGRLVDVPADGAQREAAREKALAAETARLVASRGATRIVQTHHGFVMAAAGIDASNVERSRLVLLPVDPDASARALRHQLAQRYGVEVAVVVSDTMGRPWRLGLVDLAVGAAGVAALRDHRGEFDAHGNELQITQMAVVDELAAAADLVKGKSDQIPVAVIRGYPRLSDVDDEGVRALVRAPEQDLFALGTAEAGAQALRTLATQPDIVDFADRSIDESALARALSSVDISAIRVDQVRLDKLVATLPTLPAYTREILVPGEPDGDPRSWARAGAGIQRLRTALAAEGLASAWIDPDPAVAAEIVGATPLGLLAVGSV